jgi:UDP-N-acetylglucosamine--N-acetylmuramyl-(pentapeptide) pyrophosphoryl-undecaprenol N-acetylglucosamine transferase
MAGPIVITGGGTGGHIFPMEAVADQLRALGFAPSDLRFVGSRRGQESTLLAASDVALTLLPGRGFRRSLRGDALAQNLGAAGSLLAAVAIAISNVRRWRPSVVVSLGGYASFATTLAAVLWRRPLVLVELDAEPGAAQRLFTRFARALLRFSLERSQSGRDGHAASREHRRAGPFAARASRRARRRRAADR